MLSVYFPLLCGFLLTGGAAVQAGRNTVPGSLHHRVEKGETLWLIAQRYGVSDRKLARVNDISDPSRLPVGTVLRIPLNRYDYFKKHLRVDPGIKMKKWKYIVVHHSATDIGNAHRFDLFHRKIRHMPRGLAYHFVIGNGKALGNGEIEVGSRWKLQQAGGHVKSCEFNEIALGIVLVGNYEKTSLTREQMASLVDLTRYLQYKFSIPRSRVLGHREVEGAQTRCPGRLFPLRSFRKKTLP